MSLIAHSLALGLLVAGAVALGCASRRLRDADNVEIKLAARTGYVVLVALVVIYLVRLVVRAIQVVV